MIEIKAVSKLEFHFSLPGLSRTSASRSGGGTDEYQLDWKYEEGKETYYLTVELDTAKQVADTFAAVAKAIREELSRRGID